MDSLKILPRLNAKTCNFDRLSLSGMETGWEIDFSKVMEDRLDLYKLTTFALNKKRPIHNWYPYLQGFSADLVEFLIKELGIRGHNRVLDPWCGVGTTNLVCQERGIPSIGIDISPLAVFITKTKIAGIPDPNTVNKVLLKLKRAFDKNKFQSERSHFDIINKVIPTQTYSQLVFLKKGIRDIPDKKISDFLFLALLTSLDSLSTLQKDGAHYRFRTEPKSKNVFGTFQQIVEWMLDANTLFHQFRKEVESQIYTGDSRNLSMIKDGSVHFIITSPPYLNRDNYIAQNKLELKFGDFVENYTDYRQLTFSTLRSHVEAKSNFNSFHFEIPQLSRYLKHLRDRKELLNNRKIIDMTEGYFIDMYLSLKELSRVLIKGGKAAIVVGNSCWAGISIEVDKLLAVIGNKLKLTNRSIWVTRYKLNSSQQISRFGKIPARESIIIFEKR